MKLEQSPLIFIPCLVVRPVGYVIMPMELRDASSQDAAQILILLADLGYDVPLEVVRSRLHELAGSSADQVLVAVDDDQIIGLIAVHWCGMLHAADPVARITTLVVANTSRGTGVGRKLVERAAAIARQAGCEELELTTSLKRTDAQAFYKTLGFIPSSMRLHRPLMDDHAQICPF